MFRRPLEFLTERISVVPPGNADDREKGYRTQKKPWKRNSSNKKVRQSGPKNEAHEHEQYRCKKPHEIAERELSLELDKCKNFAVLNGKSTNVASIGSVSIDPSSSCRARVQHDLSSVRVHLLVHG